MDEYKDILKYEAGLDVIHGIYKAILIEPNIEDKVFFRYDLLQATGSESAYSMFEHSLKSYSFHSDVYRDIFREALREDNIDWLDDDYGTWKDIKIGRSLINYLTREVLPTFSYVYNNEEFERVVINTLKSVSTETRVVEKVLVKTLIELSDQYRDGRPIDINPEQHKLLFVLLKAIRNDRH